MSFVTLNQIAFSKKQERNELTYLVTNKPIALHYLIKNNIRKMHFLYFITLFSNTVINIRRFFFSKNFFVHLRVKRNLDRFCFITICTALQVCLVAF